MPCDLSVHFFASLVCFNQIIYDVRQGFCDGPARVIEVLQWFCERSEMIPQWLLRCHGFATGP